VSKGRTTSTVRGTEDGIVVELEEGGDVTIRSQRVTVQCDNAVSISPSGEVAADVRTAKLLAAAVPGANAQVVLAQPAPSAPHAPARRASPLARAAAHAAPGAHGGQAQRGGGRAAARARAARAAWVRLRARRALRRGAVDPLLRLLGSPSALTRCAAVGAVTAQAARANAEGLWREGAFAADHELSRSAGASPTSLTRNSIPSPAAPKPPSAEAFLRGNGSRPLGLDAFASLSVRAWEGGGAFASLRAGYAEALQAAVVVEARRLLASPSLRHKAAACACVQKLDFAGDRLAQTLVAEGVKGRGVMG